MVDGSDRGRGVCSYGMIFVDIGLVGLVIFLRVVLLWCGG